MLTDRDIEERGTYHPPGLRATKLHEEARIQYMQAALWVNSEIPDCRETSLAQTKLEEFLFWANAAIARNHAKID